jgi:hypothetical protein
MAILLATATATYGGAPGAASPRSDERPPGRRAAGSLIGDGSSRTGLFLGYLVGAAIMMLGGVVELLIGINAEGKSLEAVTKPLSAADE